MLQSPMYPPNMYTLSLTTVAVVEHLASLRGGTCSHSSISILYLSTLIYIFYNDIRAME